MFSRPIVKVAFRDLRRNVGMTIVAMILIAIPVAAISYTATAMQTSRVDRVSSLFAEGEQATAYVISASPVKQSPDGDNGLSHGNDRVAAPDQPFVSVIEDIVAPNGVVVTSHADSYAEVRKGEGYSVFPVYNPVEQISASELIEGSLPEKGEVALARRDAILLGVRPGETIQELRWTPAGEVEFHDLAVSGITNENTVVQRSQIDFRDATYSELSGRINDLEFSVVGDSPVTWDQVKELNAYGLLVHSRYVIENPPPMADRYSELVDFDRGAGTAWASATTYAVGLLLLLGIIEVVLIITPAFTAAGKRNERNLAQMSAVGATRKQLRATMLWQGIIIGLLGSMLGLLGFGGLYVFASILSPHSNITVKWWIVPLAIAVSILLGIIASLWPAYKASKVDVVAVLANRGTGRIPSRRKYLAAPVIGGLATIGAVLISDSVGVVRDGVIFITLAFIAVMGLIFSAPVFIRLAGAAIGRVAVSARLASRDAVRNMHRTGPAVAAISVVLLMATVLTSLSLSILNAERHELRAIGPRGSVVVQPDVPNTGGDSRAILEEALADLNEIRPIKKSTFFSGVATEQAGSTWLTTLIAPGKECPAHTSDYMGNTQDAYKEYKDDPRCQEDFTRASFGWGSFQQQYVVGDAEIIDNLGAIRPEDKAKAKELLAQGGIIVGSTNRLDHGQATLAIEEQYVVDKDGKRIAEENLDDFADYEVRTDIIKEVTVPAAKLLTLSHSSSPAFVIAPSVAQEMGLDISIVGAIVEFENPLSIMDTRDFPRYTNVGQDMATIAHINQAIFTDVFWPLSIGTAFILIALLVTTAVVLLSARAARNDMDTISAIGAKPGTRRRFTAVLGGLIALAGGVPGLAAGLIATYVLGNMLEARMEYPVIALFGILGLMVAIGVLIGLLFPPKTRGLTRRMD